MAPHCKQIIVIRLSFPTTKNVIGSFKHKLATVTIFLFESTASFCCRESRFDVTFFYSVRIVVRENPSSASADLAVMPHDELSPGDMTQPFNSDSCSRSLRGSGGENFQFRGIFLNSASLII